MNRSRRIASAMPPRPALEQARAGGWKPAHERRIFAEDRLVPLGAGRDETEGRADQLLEPLEIAPRLCRQIGLVLGPARRRPPALDLLVDGLGRGHHRLVPPELGAGLPPVPAGAAALQGLALIEDVELGEGHRIEAVDARRVAADDRLAAATAPAPPGGRAALAAARQPRLGD